MLAIRSIQNVRHCSLFKDIAQSTDISGHQRWGRSVKVLFCNIGVLLLLSLLQQQPYEYLIFEISSDWKAAAFGNTPQNKTAHIKDPVTRFGKRQQGNVEFWSALYLI